jgi:hypothetical protein
MPARRLPVEREDHAMHHSVVGGFDTAGGNAGLVCG